MTAVLRLLLRSIYRVRTIVTRPAAPSTPLLYVALHRCLFDSALIALFAPRQPVVVLPPEELRAWWMRLLMRGIPHLVAEANDPATVKKVLRLLASGRAVVVYPEGRVVDASGVMKNYAVPALIAAKAGAAVVPVVVCRTPGRLPRVALRVGPAAFVGADPPEGLRTARAKRAWATQQMQRLLETASLDARERTSLFEAFLDAVRAHGRRWPIIEDVNEKPRTYQDLLKGALLIGRWASLRTQRGENVGLLLPNVIPSACALLGLMAFGRVPAMLNYTAGPVAVHGACTAAGVRTVITSRAFIEQARLGPVLAAMRGLAVTYLEDVRSQLSVRDWIWLLAFALWLPRRATAPPSAHDPAVVMFTSGSEARPKGVALSHDAIIANIRQIATVMDFTARDKILNALPIYHTYSFTAGLMLCLLSGTRLFLYVSPLRYRAIPEIAYRRDVTGLYGTSTFLSYWAKYASPLDFHTVRYVISGGEKLGEEVARMYVDKFGLRIYEGYGATECAPVIALATPQCYRAGSVGRVLPGMEYRVERVEGIPRGGVLHLKGPNVMLGYYRFERPGVIDPPRSELGEGWYSTGDVVDIGEDGNVSVIGRVKRFAKIAGEMVSLDVIESIALAASPDHKHAVVLRAESASGETTVLFTTDPSLTRVSLLHAARQLGWQELAVARRVVHMVEIPLLATGKTDYVTLQALGVSEEAANEPAAGALVAEPRTPAQIADERSY